MAGASERPDQPPADRSPHSPQGMPGAPPGTRRRLRDRYEGTRARAEATWHQIEESRHRVSRVDIAFRLYERDREVAGPLLAGAMAFRLFLWLIPFTLVLVVSLAFVADIGDKPPSHVAQDAGLTGYLAVTVARATSDSNSARWLLLLGGLWALLLATRSLTKALRTAFALAWGLPRQRGGTTRLTLTVGGTLLALVLLSNLAAGIRAKSSGPGLWIMLFMIVLFAAAWTWLSTRLPHADVSWKDLVPGAILVAVGTQALYLLSVLWYVPHAARASDEYGSLGLAILLLGWLFILARLIMSSAVLNATLWARRAGEHGG